MQFITKAAAVIKAEILVALLHKRQCLLDTQSFYLHKTHNILKAFYSILNF